MGANSGNYYYTHAGQGGAPPPDDLGRKISRPAAVGRARIKPAKAAAAANLGRWIFVFSGHLRPTHTSFLPFLDPLNSFPWSLFADSSPLKTKLVDCWIEFFRPPQQPLDQGEGTDVFLVSWAFHLYVVCKFWTSFG